MIDDVVIGFTVAAAAVGFLAGWLARRLSNSDQRGLLNKLSQIEQLKEQNAALQAQQNSLAADLFSSNSLKADAVSKLAARDREALVSRLELQQYRHRLRNPTTANVATGKAKRDSVGGILDKETLIEIDLTAVVPQH